MPSAKSRAVRVGVKYAATHPQSRVTRFAARLILRRLAKRFVVGAEIAAFAWIVLATGGLALVVAGAVVVLKRRKRRAQAKAAVASPGGMAPATPFPPASAPAPSFRPAQSPATSPPAADAPFPAAAPAAAPPETRDAPSTTPTTSPASESAAAAPQGDLELVARVEAKLQDSPVAPTVDVEEHAGVITLRGQVADEEAEHQVVREAEEVDGVKAVQSELETAEDEPAS